MKNAFEHFADRTASTFQYMVKNQDVFVADVDGSALFQLYLASFPVGTDPVFKTRTEHDCSCCKNFVRRLGNVVTVDDRGELRTIWDDAAAHAPHPYNIVASAMRDRVKAAHVVDVFRVRESDASIGTAHTLYQNTNNKVVTFDHFYSGPIPQALRVAQPATVRGDYRTTVQVFERGLNELSVDAVTMVLSLIRQNALYRGQEHQAALVAFQKAQNDAQQLSSQKRAAWVFRQAKGPAARFRNTVVGSLVQDLSLGVELEAAVGAYESKVAPHNYKRSTALVTPMMVSQAMKVISELGLEQALQRRFARIDDVSVNDVLWVDTSVKPLMKDGLLSQLMQVAQANSKNVVDTQQAETIHGDAFVRDVLPLASGLEVLFAAKHLGNLMSLTAPVHADPKQLFCWNNDFAWSYAGNITDSIKERVKKAGGNVHNAKLRVSLSWHNFDDLDLHVYEPGAKRADDKGHIYFRNKNGAGGGQLDVDMNAGGGHTRQAVENVSWVRVNDGDYKIVVNNYAQRERTDVGFVVEVESAGKVMHFQVAQAVRHQEDIVVATLHVKYGEVAGFTVGHKSVGTATPCHHKWGLQTEQFVKVNTVTWSPNYWGNNQVGNKHLFFVVDGAKNDEATRGIYNEFLHPRLAAHRKVFELIGDKTQCQPTDGQLSGLGFSSTKGDMVTVRVTSGQRRRLYAVHFGGTEVK